MNRKKTDAAGYIHFEKNGDYILGNNSSGIALIKLDHRSWILNNFDVAGRTLNTKNTDMFIYTDRGVHRPGDTVHLSAIVRINSTIPPEKQPVLLKIKNPQGQIVHNDRKPCGSNGHVYFPISTELTDPTGNWLAELTIGDQKFTQVLRIETIKPFRLKIDTDLPEKLMPPNLKIDGFITSKYLFGAPASKLETVVKAQLSKATFVPPDYPDYVFSSPLKTFQERQLTIFKGKLNENGKRRINYRLPDLSKISHPLNARITTMVYEKGGSFTSQSDMIKVYPHSAQTGIKNIFKSRSVRIGEKYQVPILVVDTNGKPVSNHRLKIAVYVNRSHWWWDYDRREKRDFRMMESTYLIEKHQYLSAGEPLLHALSVDDYGRHYIEVTDLETGHESGIFFYVSGWGQLPVEERKRNYLHISSDKNIYNVGDQAKLSFESPQAGMALLTVEQGSRIISTNWKNVSPGQTTFTVNLNKEMLPNCYASISMIQPHNQNTNDVPMRLYGVKTLYVEDK